MGLSSSGSCEPVAAREVFWFCFFFPCPYRETEHKLNHSAAKNKQAKHKVIPPRL